ncbi:MAG: hypothetical protein ABSE06_12455, partial [Anaerolineaceae bacterium]
KPHIGRGEFMIFQSFDEYVASVEFGLSSDTSLHTGLLPLPFAGNLEKASIFVLMLNPGLSAGDYFAEQRIREFREAHIRNLRQENSDDEYPFVFLNTQFAWHPGFEYWKKKLDNIIGELAKHDGITYQQAMSKLAKNMACLELIPYHSKRFPSILSFNNLPSMVMMRKFVNEIVLPKAINGETIIIVTRGAKIWNLNLPNDEQRNIIIYKKSEARSAYLSKTSPGGKAILKHFGIVS